MEQRRLGNSGLQVSAISLGCMSIGIADVYTSSAKDETKAVELIRHALDLGINFLDTANIYGDSEIKVGRALQGQRDGVVLATLRYGPATRSPSFSDGFVNRLQDVQFPSLLLFKLRGLDSYPGGIFTHCSCQTSLDAHISVLIPLSECVGD